VTIAASTKYFKHTEPTREDIERQLSFFANVPATMQPKGIRRMGDCAYEYEFIQGGAPTEQKQIDRLYMLAERVLWNTGGQILANIDKWQYGNYVLEKALQLELHRDQIDTVVLALRLIVDSPLRRARMCHGDFTMENVIFSDDDPVLIDPGHPRGVPCKELDEAKMLQSLLCKWDIMNGSTAAYWLKPPFEPQPIHMAFLITHWIRLLNHPERHVKPGLIKSAHEVLGKLLEDFKK
jgi:hypothetical protein